VRTSIGQKRKAQGLAEPYQQQLNSYALAAAAAGVGLLALTKPSEAKIVYTPTHQVIGNGDSYHLDFTGGGRTTLTFQNKYYSACTTEGSCFPNEQLFAQVAEGDQVVHDFFGAVAIKSGVEIGLKYTFSGGRERMVSLQASRTFSAYGSWINVKNRYLGVRFKIKGELHYGWARLSVQVQPPLTVTATLTGYAYETTPNKPIIAGKTKGADGSVEQPATLGRLALGRR